MFILFFIYFYEFISIYAIIDDEKSNISKESRYIMSS